jgi:flagellar FliJ protein
VKKFRFRLEKIEKLRKDKKRRVQRAFAEAKRREKQERDKLAMLRREVAMRRQDSVADRVKKISLDRLRSSGEYIVQLEFLIEHQRRQVADASNRTAECRGKLEEASKEVRKFERLEEIKREQYTREMETFLQKEIDETASNMSRR